MCYARIRIFYNVWYGEVTVLVWYIIVHERLTGVRTVRIYLGGVWYCMCTGLHVVVNIGIVHYDLVYCTTMRVVRVFLERRYVVVPVR